MTNKQRLKKTEVYFISTGYILITTSMLTSLVSIKPAVILSGLTILGSLFYVIKSYNNPQKSKLKHFIFPLVAFTFFQAANFNKQSISSTTFLNNVLILLGVCLISWFHYYYKHSRN